MLVPLGKGIGNRTMSIGTSWLRALGRWSYEIYLFHMLPLIGLMLWFKQNERSGAAFVATYTIMLAASIALGFLVSRYFSGPLNRRLRGEIGGFRAPGQSADHVWRTRLSDQGARKPASGGSSTGHEIPATSAADMPANGTPAVCSTVSHAAANAAETSRAPDA